MADSDGEMDQEEVQNVDSAEDEDEMEQEEEDSDDEEDEKQERQVAELQKGVSFEQSKRNAGSNCFLVADLKECV